MSGEWVQFDHWLALYLITRQTPKDHGSFTEVEHAIDRSKR